MTKPIDWTLPLRVVGTHERVDRVEIYPYGIRAITRDQAHLISRPVDKDGRGAGFAVENIPPEPRIVERWGYVTPVDGAVATYSIPLQRAMPSEHVPMPPGARRAKLLIEEHD